MPPRSAASGVLLAFAYLAFVSLGLPDALLGVAWPSVRDGFSLSQAALGVPLAVAALSYFTSGLLGGRLVGTFGVGALLAVSTGLAAAGVFGYATAPHFVVFVLSAAVVAFGSGAIDTALNAYAARHFSAKHMSWLHAAYAVGATAGPAIMTTVIARGASWRVGYGVVGALLATLAVAFVATQRRWSDGPSDAAAENEAPVIVSAGEAARDRRVRLQAGIFFLYGGTEVTLGQWSFTILTESRGFDVAAAGSWVAAFWGGLLAGRVLLGFVVERIGQVRLLRLSTAGVLVSAACFAVPGLSWNVAALPVISFSLASIYPGLMAETPRRVGAPLAPHAVGFQVSAATAGLAALPALAGVIAARAGLPWIGLLVVASAAAMLVLHERLVAVADPQR